MSVFIADIDVFHNQIITWLEIIFLLSLKDLLSEIHNNDKIYYKIVWILA